ncbi:hypothetical protein [Billgrantia antri]|uniref:Stage II sporulation protein M n=1 Tax=Billgrantia antri TaxID=2846777 RepID=A0ABS6ZMM4_9GAMM|nr:hypothetical protein [Halomonas antri]MBW6391326.1 hypothetical protein [Halomonas antri]
MDNTITNVYLIVAIAGTLGLFFALIASLWREALGSKEEDVLLPILIRLENITIRNVPHAAANSLNNFFSVFWGSQKTICVTAVIRATTLSMGGSLFALILGRAYAVDSLAWALEDVFSGGALSVVSLYFLVVNAIFAVPSVLLTRHLVKKAASSKAAGRVGKYLLLDTFAAYLFVSLNLYFLYIGVNSVLALANADLQSAIEVVKVMAQFQHMNAVQWPVQSSLMIDGVSATIYALLSFIPTLLFVGLISSSLIGYCIVKIIHKLALKTTEVLTLGEKTALASVASGLFMFSGALAAWGKVLELVSSAN